MTKIYTVGLQRMKLPELQALVSAIGAQSILDWRSKADGRLAPPTLERAFPGRYKYVGKTCNESKITDAALRRLAQVTDDTLLLFHKEIPGNCPRHESLALPLKKAHGVSVTHVFQDELIVASELQRSIDDDNDYQSTTWKHALAAAAPSAPASHPAPINTIGDLADRAMVVRLTIRMFGAQRQDKQVNSEVAAKYGSDASMTKFTKSLLAKESMARLNQLESSIRQEHYSRTLPWNQDGTRILSAAGYMDYAQFMRNAEAQWQPAVDDFLANWDAFVADARVKLNGLFDEKQYPKREQLRRRFEFAWQVFPVPVANDFRVQLAAGEIDTIKAQIEATLRATVDQSMTDIWERLCKVVTAMRDRLNEKKDDGTYTTFKDSLVTNITDLLAIVPSLNLTGDPNVAAFCAQIQSDLTRFEPDKLREDEKAREDTARRADEILSKMSAFMA